MIQVNMKAYLITTAIVFALITVLHIWRAIEEGSHLASSRWFILTTGLAAALCLWAVRLIWRTPRS
ncbi:MAG: hypothetical protein JOY62_11065 [Acidobacteriaceae bacterium]|nr:hypothetical protein [Acidobacteriaceae bacterium]MBV9780500.1 hypothetical protein [Acidobacteriaceae bacterium]